MATHKFSQAAIDRANEIARAHFEKHPPTALRQGSGDSQISIPDHLKITAECISVSVNNNDQICIDLPVVGEQCIGLPISVPPGTLAQACLSVCYRWVPTGVTVTISVGGNILIEKSFGWC